MADKKIFTHEGDGFTVDVKLMENGETRHRLATADGAAYIRTETSTGGWQRAHHHRGVSETYIVQKGWMGFAHGVPGNYTLDIYKPGDVVTTAIGHDHNVYLPSGAVILTVRHGKPVPNPDNKGNDWYDADAAFAKWSSELPPDTVEGAFNGYT